MLYLGIDQHAKQLTVDICNEAGDLVMHRQVKTRWSSLREFFAGLRDQAGTEGYMAIVEVCGFNEYLLELLQEYGCTLTLVVQPTKRKKRKTDRRDARSLRESLWLNRERLREGKRPAKLRVIRPASREDAADRQLTALRVNLIKQRTKIVNKVQTILRKWNLQHDCPTKGIQTKKAYAWLEQLDLPMMDRLEMDMLLQQWELIQRQVKLVDETIRKQLNRNDIATVLNSIPGMSNFNSLTVACRVGDIEDFPRGQSLANFWGLTPGACNSGDGSRNTSITKAGSSHVRYVLGQVVVHILKKDAWMRQWYQKIKRRRGTKIARVAVMRRLATVIWSMVKHRLPYQTGGPEAFQRMLKVHLALQVDIQANTNRQ